MPCTVTYRFFIRDGRLEMHTSMRSQDLWLGFPYDLFTATTLQELLAGWCGVDVGAYHHEVSSLHLYRRDLHVASAVHPIVEAAPIGFVEQLAVPWEEMPAVVDRLLAGVAVSEPGWATVSGVLRSYPLWRAGRHLEARELAGATPGALARALEGWYDHLSATAARAVAS